MIKSLHSRKKKMFASVLLSFIATAQATPVSSGCVSTESQSTTIKISPFLNAEIKVTSCNRDAQSGDVNVNIAMDDKKQEFVLPYEASAYSLQIDTSMDLNNDGIPDVEVSNGGGRGGEGTWYWAFDKSNGVFAYLGEAPALRIDSSNSKKIFATVSGSGDVQAVRYNYVVRDLKLVISDAAAFTPTGNSYRVSVMECIATSACRETRVIEKVPALLAQSCMAGTHECKF